MSKIIVVSEDGMFANGPIPVTEMTDLFCAALTGAVQQIRNVYKHEEDADKIDKELFDCMNHSFSKCLENAFPEMEMHPELTEEAMQRIMRAEEELIEERAAALDNIIPIKLENKLDE